MDPSRRRIRAVTVAGAVLALGCARALACSDAAEGPLRPTDGGTSEGSTTTGAAGGSSSTTTTGSGGADAAPPIPSPCPEWPGWETWDDFAPECPFCVPASKDALPAPIQWEPCDPLFNMPTGCQRMKVDWPYYNTPFAYAFGAYVGADGKVVLDFDRRSDVAVKPWGMKIVAEADGPVHTAFLNPRQDIKGCAFIFQPVASAAQGKYAMTIEESDGTDVSFPEAAVGGSIDELHPKVQQIWNPSGGHGLTASDLVWATWDGTALGVAPWGQPWQVVWSAAQDDGAGQYQAKAWHDFVAWDAGDVYQHIMAWTPDRGAYPLVAFPGDWSRGAAAMGTDGQQLVWMQGEGKAGPAEVPYATESVMAAPFTTDPAMLAPKRLRSIPTTLPPVTPWIVGCGYAANEYTSLHVLIVRLSDGWSWELTPPNPGAPPKEQRSFSTVYALTCDEIFLQSGVGLAANIARVRLDALGPGMPPD